MGTTEGGTDDAGTGTDTGGRTDTGTGTGTGGMDRCAGLGRDQCTRDNGCAPIVCQPYMMDNTGVAGFCLGEQEFIGCQSATIACAEVETTTCDGDDATVYLCPNACIPSDWMECPAPVDGKVSPCGGSSGGG